jgi:hypothetical protein
MVGDSLDAWLGDVVGVELRAFVGDSVGISDGIVDGATDGDVVGNEVGFLDDMFEGSGGVSLEHCVPKFMVVLEPKSPPVASTDPSLPSVREKYPSP